MASPIGAPEKVGAPVSDVSVSAPVSGVSDRVVMVTVPVSVSITVEEIVPVSVPISVVETGVVRGWQASITCRRRSCPIGSSVVIGGVLRCGNAGVAVLVTGLSVVDAATLPSTIACQLRYLVVLGGVKGSCLVGRRGIYRLSRAILTRSVSLGVDWRALGCGLFYIGQGRGRVGVGNAETVGA